MARSGLRGKHPAEKVLAKRHPIPYLESGLPSIEPIKTGTVRRFRRPEGADLRSVQQTVLRGLADAERRLPHLRDQIVACAREADPLMLYSGLVTLAGMRRAAPGHVIFGMDAAVEFYGGLVTSLPAEEVVARVGVEYHPGVLYRIDGLLREYAVTEQQVDQGRVMWEGAPDPLVGARHLLEFEQRFDRMLGYPDQLRPIFQAVADRLADRSRSALGFALGDALTIADAYSEVLAELRHRTVGELQVVLDHIPPDADADTVIQYLAAHSAGLAIFGAAPTEEDLVGVLTERTGIAGDEVTKLVTALATPLGSQPNLTAMDNTNTLRRRSIISLPDGRHLWAVPDDFIHTVLDWAVEVSQNDTRLIEVFDRRRQAVCEELTHQALAGIFGEQDVHRGVTYPADGQRPDIDVLVATSGASILVEAKAGRFTDAARRGAPERLKKRAVNSLTRRSTKTPVRSRTSTMVRRICGTRTSAVSRFRTRRTSPR